MDTDPTPATPTWKPSDGLKAGRFSDLAARLKGTYLRLGFMHEGQEFGLSVRRLSSAEMDLADAHVRNILPPVKNEKADMAVDKYDFTDADYIKQSALARARQVAQLLDLAIEGGIPSGEGSGMDQKAEWLNENMPSPILTLLVDKVVDISARGTVEKAAFF